MTKIINTQSSSLVAAAAGFCGSAVAIGNDFMRALSHAASQVFKGSGDNPFPTLIESIATQKGVNKLKANAVKDTAQCKLAQLQAFYTGKLTTEQKATCDDMGDLFSLDFMAEYENILAQYKAADKARLLKAKKAKEAKATKEAAVITVDHIETVTGTIVTSGDIGTLSGSLALVIDSIDMLSPNQLAMLTNALALHKTESAIKELIAA